MLLPANGIAKLYEFTSKDFPCIGFFEHDGVIKAYATNGKAALTFTTDLTEVPDSFIYITPNTQKKTKIKKARWVEIHENKLRVLDCNNNVIHIQPENCEAAPYSLDMGYLMDRIAKSSSVESIGFSASILNILIKAFGKDTVFYFDFISEDEPVFFYPSSPAGFVGIIMPVILE